MMEISSSQNTPILSENKPQKKALISPILPNQSFSSVFSNNLKNGFSKNSNEPVKSGSSVPTSAQLPTDQTKVNSRKDFSYLDTLASLSKNPVNITANFENIPIMKATAISLNTYEILKSILPKNLTATHSASYVYLSGDEKTLLDVQNMVLESPNLFPKDYYLYALRSSQKTDEETHLAIKKALSKFDCKVSHSNGFTLISMKLLSIFNSIPRKIKEADFIPVPLNSPPPDSIIAKIEFKPNTVLNADWIKERIQPIWCLHPLANNSSLILSNQIVLLIKCNRTHLLIEFLKSLNSIQTEFTLKIREPKTKKKKLPSFKK
jgi:hypothetical protein